MSGWFRAPAARPRTIERETVAVTLGDGRVIELVRVRDPRARRMRLVVSARGARLTLPPRTSDRTGERFVLEHGDWLAAQLARRDSTVEPLRPHVPARIPLRGDTVPVEWVPGRFLRLQPEPGAIVVTAPEGVADAALRRALRDFYEAQARADVGRWLPRYLPGLPRAPTRVRYRMMSSLWGSLTRDGAMSLDLALVLASPAAFEYVLVHELCHLLHMDHSRAFWREVEARCPDWRAQRAYFKGDGRRLKSDLMALCGNGA